MPYIPSPRAFVIMYITWERILDILSNSSCITLLGLFVYIFAFLRIILVHFEYYQFVQVVTR